MKSALSRHNSVAHPTEDSVRYFCRHPACPRSEGPYARRDARDDHEKRCEYMRRDPGGSSIGPLESCYPPESSSQNEVPKDGGV